MTEDNKMGKGWAEQLNKLEKLPNEMFDKTAVWSKLHSRLQKKEKIKRPGKPAYQVLMQRGPSSIFTNNFYPYYFFANALAIHHQFKKQVINKDGHKKQKIYR